MLTFKEPTEDEIIVRNLLNLYFFHSWFNTDLYIFLLIITKSLHYLYLAFKRIFTFKVVIKLSYFVGNPVT